MLKTFLLINPVLISLFWAISLMFNRREHAAAKRFLGVFMLLAFTLYGAHNIYFHSLWDIYLYVDGLYTFVSLAAFPMFYIYVRLLTVDQKFTWRKHGKYLLVPLVFGVAIYVMDIIMTKDEWLYYIQWVLQRGDVPNRIQRVTLGIYTASRFAFGIEVLWYYYQAHILIKDHNDVMQNYYSDVEERGLKWLENFNVVLFVVALVGVVMAIIGRENFVGKVELLIVPSAVLSGGIFIFGYLGSKQRNVQIKDKVKPNMGTVSLPVELEVQRRLLKLFDDEKLYLKQNLKLWDLANKLQVGKEMVSHILQNRFQQNFASFVNYYRIEHAKELLNQNNKITAEEVALRSGFGSVTAFYRVFYLKEGVTLTEYLNALRH